VQALSVNNLNIQLTIQAAKHKLPATGGSVLLAGEVAKVTLNITGKYDGGAVSALHPGAWIRPRLKNRSSCKNAVKNYLNSGPNASRDIDLNSYSFITLNQDNSVSIIDPRLNLATANLLALKKLDSKIVDWYLDSAAGEIFLLLADTNKISIISALSGALIADITLPALPQQMVVAAQQNLLWVAGRKALMVIDSRTYKLLKTIPLSAGKVYVAISQANGQLWVYVQDSGELIAVDLVTLEIKWRRPLPKKLSSLVYSKHADRLYFGSKKKPTIISLYPGSDTEIARTKLISMPEKLEISPDGQWLFALDFDQRQLAIIDTANNQPKHYLLFKHNFDQLALSDQFAYLRHNTSPNISLIRLGSINRTKSPALIEVPFGTTPPGKQRSNFSAIEVLPEGGAVLVSNSADKTLYLYMEDGMLAPANAFKVYTEAPVALLVHDKSFVESKAGWYETATMVPKPGDYELVLYLDNPPVASCFPFSVATTDATFIAEPNLPIQAIQLITSIFHAGTPAEVTVKLITQTHIGETDLQMLFFKPGSNWQKRLFAKANKNQEYSVLITFPESGKHMLAIQSNKLKLTYKQKQIKTIEVLPQ
jgi:DNA-binding beta-propeller fold protein YncE